MEAYKTARLWLVVGLGALLLAGLLSFVLVVGRAPGLQHLITDPQFARRSLVVHVNLSLFVWLSAILASLYALLPPFTRRPFLKIEPAGIAMFGVALLVLSGGSSATPIMSNYIPVLEHPVFFIGMGLVLIALLITYSKAFPGVRPIAIDTHHPILPPVVQWGLRWAGFAFLIAVVTLALTYWHMPKDLPNRTLYYDWLFWGAGHVLQTVNVLGMMNVWLILFHRLYPWVSLNQWIVNGLFASLALPLLNAIYIAFQAGDAGVYYVQFTRLMQWGIFPGVLGFLLLLIVTAVRQPRWVLRSVSTQSLLLGLGTSVTLILTGFILGALIRSSNTLVPAHYHAAIGSITVSYMVVVYQLLEYFGFSIGSAKWQRRAAWQPVLFGFGQTIFALGFALAGLTRKVYGAEQHIRTLKELIGMGLMGVGGFMAITGGVLFIWIVLSSLSPAFSIIINKRRALWKAIKSIPFRS